MVGTALQVRKESGLVDYRGPLQIYFVSDLHFDYTNRKYDPNSEDKNLQRFLLKVKAECSGNYLLILAGDFYDDYRKTLNLVKLMEQLRIPGFFVLGNHDYWTWDGLGTRTHRETLLLFDRETSHHEYFKFLTTGKVYHEQGLTIIGDTGWTSFQQITGPEISKAELNRLPKVEAHRVADFSHTDIFALHKDWVTFANKVYASNQDVLTVTHFPMVTLKGKGEQDFWWSSCTKIKNTDGWFISGHTHRSIWKHKNHISRQLGYADKDFDFGVLHQAVKHTSPETYPVLINTILTDFYDFNVHVEESEVSKRGYKRASANLRHMKSVIYELDTYLSYIEEALEGYSVATYGGLTYTDLISAEYVYAVTLAVEVLRKRDMSDIRVYMLAIILTGYVASDEWMMLPSMRKLDDVDVLRMTLVFMTVGYFQLPSSDVYAIRKSGRKKDFIEYMGVQIYLPALNEAKYVMPVDQVLEAVQKMPAFGPAASKGFLHE